jgi:cytosine/adenosine deaminase-related metal-dependent hydrolase
LTDLLVRNGYVVTVDPQRHIYARGSVAVDNGVISYVGPSSAGPKRAETVIEAEEMLVLPGLVDSHHHPAQYLAKGLLDDIWLVDGMYRHLFPCEAAQSHDDTYYSAMGSLIEALRTGTTCINDPGGPDPAAVCRAVRDVGLRAAVSVTTVDLTREGVRAPGADTESALADYDPLFAEWSGAANGRIRIWFSARTAHAVSDELYVAVKAAADRRATGLHTHAATSAWENQRSLELFGARTVRRFHELGLLSSNLCLAHVGFVDEHEVGLLAESATKVVHTPSASLFLPHGDITEGMFPVMDRAGVTIGLGSDAPAGGRFLDMVRVMWVAATAHRDRAMDPKLWGAYKALELATVGGAAVTLWEDQIGSLEPGKAGDVVLVNMAGYQWQPNFDPVRNLVYGACGDSVDTVVVAGSVLMRGRQLTTVDEALVRAEVRERATRIASEIGVEAAAPWPVVADRSAGL